MQMAESLLISENSRNIRNKIEYNKLLSNYLLLNVESLKYYAQTNNFKKIIEKAREV